MTGKQSNLSVPPKRTVRSVSPIGRELLVSQATLRRAARRAVQVAVLAAGITDDLAGVLAAGPRGHHAVGYCPAGGGRPGRRVAVSRRGHRHRPGSVTSAVTSAAASVAPAAAPAARRPGRRVRSPPLPAAASTPAAPAAAAEPAAAASKPRLLLR